MKPIKEGKVREIYDNGDNLIMVATDRISCFDVILKNNVTKKGTVLTQMSKFWFNMTEDILPNHMISTDVKDMPEFFQQPQFDGNSMMCRKLNMLPIECIVRGYITGSGWASYQKDGTVCGIKLPDGLRGLEDEVFRILDAVDDRGDDLLLHGVRQVVDVVEVEVEGGLVDLGPGGQILDGDALQGFLGAQLQKSGRDVAAGTGNTQVHGKLLSQLISKIIVYLPQGEN